MIAVHPGDTVRVELPFSEVCMHMRVAGTVMDVRLLEGGHAAQLLTPAGKPFSFPILPGEAGLLYRDGHHVTEREAP